MSPAQVFWVSRARTPGSPGEEQDRPHGLICILLGKQLSEELSGRRALSSLIGFQQSPGLGVPSNLA